MLFRYGFEMGFSKGCGEVEWGGWGERGGEWGREKGDGGRLEGFLKSVFDESSKNLHQWSCKPIPPYISAQTRNLSRTTPSSQKQNMPFFFQETHLYPPPNSKISRPHHPSSDHAPSHPIPATNRVLTLPTNLPRPFQTPTHSS